MLSVHEIGADDGYGGLVRVNGGDGGDGEVRGGRRARRRNVGGRRGGDGVGKLLVRIGVGKALGDRDKAAAVDVVAAGDTVVGIVGDVMGGIERVEKLVDIVGEVMGGIERVEKLVDCVAGKAVVLDIGSP